MSLSSQDVIESCCDYRWHKDCHVSGDHVIPTREKEMISTHQDSFDFQGNTAAVLSVKPLRSAPDCSKTSSEDLNAKLIGDSPAMHTLKRSIRAMASSSETVLITGESGTGKELIARAVHDLSSRRDKAFVPVNCGALNESLLESELFGHVKGAFTGATASKKGFFEAASGGTIFLDEFAEMSLATQQRLLRVLQEGAVRPVGSTDAREIQIDTRIVVATNHDLKRDVKEGRFRHDLYYRVNVLQISSPALRFRPEDILTLAVHFIRKYNDKNSGKVSEGISPDVLAVLQTYSWPGNVRELENIIKRLALSASIEGIITKEHLERVREFDQIADESTQHATALEGGNQVARKLNCISGRRNDGVPCRCKESMLNEYQNLVNEVDGNLAEAARRLNIPRTTLRKRIVSLRIKCRAS
jgi:transcriptional regulator with PAS, ATPase and Fis domain